jgi:hypothetical protein
MMVESVEVLTLEAATDMRRQARREKREERERAEKMTMRDVKNLFWADLSMLRARAALYDSEPTESPLPPIPEDEVDEYKEPEIIRLLLFARASGWRPILVQFSRHLSEAFEGRFRQSAKARNLALHFYRLTGAWVILEVQPKETPDESDANFLKGLGVQW